MQDQLSIREKLKRKGQSLVIGRAGRKLKKG